MPNRRAAVYVNDILAGHLAELEEGKQFSFFYHPEYSGPPVSLTMPVKKEPYMYDRFPPFFDGLLPEGIPLESLLRLRKIDAYDYFSQLVAVGADMVGNVTVRDVTGKEL